jgi:nitrite reductase/ring-hydroxylating ferredoxin subunit
MTGMSDAQKITVCDADELGELEARGWELDPYDEMTRFLVVRKNGRVYGYRNICPHAGAALNWSSDKFLSYDRRRLQCSLHGAQFEIETGRCVGGPCSGRGLTPVTTRIEDGKIIIDCSQPVIES